MAGAVIIPFAYVIPLRYQIAAGSDPLEAGVRLLPFSLTAPFGSLLVACSFKEGRFAPLYAMILGSIFQVFGILGASRGPADKPDWYGLPGVSLVTGLGVGFCLCAATILTLLVMEHRDLCKCSSVLS
jgi:hypothetical protein